MEHTLTRKETKTSYAYYLDGKRLYRGKGYTQYLKTDNGKIPVWFNEYLFPQFAEIPMKYVDGGYDTIPDITKYVPRGIRIPIMKNTLISPSA